MFSRGGTLLPSIYAVARYIDDVIVSKAAGGNFDHTMCYINIIGVAAGGQAGGFDGVGTISSLGVLNHELGHALSLPHWSGGAGYPYYGDMHSMTAPNNGA